MKKKNLFILVLFATFFCGCSQRQEAPVSEMGSEENEWRGVRMITE